jgi:hypothetical protein
MIAQLLLQQRIKLGVALSPSIIHINAAGRFFQSYLCPLVHGSFQPENGHVGDIS